MTPKAGDALVIVDVQNDFLPDGRLGVTGGNEVVPVLNRYIEQFRQNGLPVFATRDWHPPDHCSFSAQGGPWPPHCIRDTRGAAFASDLRLPDNAIIISKARNPDQDAYSGFDGTELAAQLRQLGVRRVWIGGLATDYCVLATIRDAVAEGLTTFWLKDASRAVNATPGNDLAAAREIAALGVPSIDLASPPPPDTAAIAP